MGLGRPQPVHPVWHQQTPSPHPAALHKAALSASSSSSPPSGCSRSLAPVQAPSAAPGPSFPIYLWGGSPSPPVAPSWATGTHPPAAPWLGGNGNSGRAPTSQVLAPIHILGTSPATSGGSCSPKPSAARMAQETLQDLTGCLPFPVQGCVTQGSPGRTSPSQKGGILRRGGPWDASPLPSPKLAVASKPQPVGCPWHRATRVHIPCKRDMSWLLSVPFLL